MVRPLHRARKHADPRLGCAYENAQVNSSDNEPFRKWLLETVFALTYRPSEADAA